MKIEFTNFEYLIDHFSHGQDGHKNGYEIISELTHNISEDLYSNGKSEEYMDINYQTDVIDSGLAQFLVKAVDGVHMIEFIGTAK